MDTTMWVEENHHLALSPSFWEGSKERFERWMKEDKKRRQAKKELKISYEGFDDTMDEDYNLAEYTCTRYKPCEALVCNYARMGLHRYNLLQGTNLQLVRVEKYNYTTHSAACTFFITLVAAVDPAAKDSSSLTFHTKVCEQSYGQFELACSIACPLGASTHEGALGMLVYPDDSFPECPPEDPFENQNLFYVVKKSELKQHYDWIRLYLELAVGKPHMGRDLDLSSDLTIVKVAIETIDDDDVNQPKQPNEKWLNAMNAIVYIRYKDFCEARVGKDFDRIAIVKRTFNESIGCFMLNGLNESSEILPKKKARKQSQRYLGVHGSLRRHMWRMANLRLHKRRRDVYGSIDKGFKRFLNGSIDKGSIP